MECRPRGQDVPAAQPVLAAVQIRDEPAGLAHEQRTRGHVVRRSVDGYGGYQAILWNEAQGVYYGASESRKDGQAAGF